MSRRKRRWQSAAESHYYQPGPDDESESEDGEPDVCPVCSLVGTHKLQCPQRGLWPQELAEQREPHP